MGSRDQWGSQLQFILTCIGFSVGLGNLWRFPSVAYKHGGGAFLIPYIICSIVFGLPCLYLEFFVGQFTQTGPSKAFRQFMPAMQGIGWTMSIAGFCVGIYYNVIIVWCLRYIFDVFTGKYKLWTKCTNDWNSINCTESGSPNSFNISSFVLPAEEYFNHHLLQLSSGIEETGSFNWGNFIGLVIIWTLTALCLIKGVKWIGRISYITATLPYLIIGILFVRGVTLDGAINGLNFYLFKPNFEKLWIFETWIAATTQMCFSLSIGFGGLLSLASYNKRNHNFYRDALIVIFCDSFMSIFGGCAVFSIMGFLSKHTGRDITELIEGGTGLAFIAYPEAISRMPVPFIWAFLLFLMFFLLGISSQFGLTQGFVTALVDQMPFLLPRQWIVVTSVCFVSFIAGLSMCTQSGYFWFELFNNWMGGTTVLIMCLLELFVVVHIYGIRNVLKDIREMLGKPSTKLSHLIGPSGYIFTITWTTVTPVILISLIISSIWNQISNPFKSGFYEYPSWAKDIGFLLMYTPICVIPFFTIYNVYFFIARKQHWTEIFMIQPKLPSYARIRAQTKIFPVVSTLKS